MSVRINAGKKGQVNPEASICVNSRRCVSRWCVCVCAYVWALGTCLPEQVWNLAANWLDSAAPQNRARHDQIQEGFFLRSMNCKRKSANAVRPLHFVASLVFKDKAAGVVIHFSYRQQTPWNDQNQQCSSHCLNTVWLLYSVWFAQPQAHWFLVRKYIFKHVSQIQKNSPSLFL